MQRNVGSLDRTLRIVIGLGVSSLAFVGPQNLWFLLGLIPLATGLIGWCPPYTLLSISTNKSCTSCSNQKPAT